MKKLFLIMLLLFAIQITNAQAHQMGANYNCKLQKGSFNTEKHYCAACAAKDKKEQDAKIAEDKRRFAAAQAEAEAKKAASENARLEKLRIEQAEEKIRKTEKVVVVNNSVDKAINIKQLESDKIYQNQKKSYFYSPIFWTWPNTLIDWVRVDSDRRKEDKGFILNGKPLFNNKEFLKCIAIPDPNLVRGEEYLYNFPQNIGIVVLNQINNKNPKRSFYICDLINANGKRVLNDEDIGGIIHFVDDYFIVFKGNYYSNIFDEAYIYNTKTKIAHPLSKQTHSSTVQCASTTNYGFGIDEEDLLNKETYKSFFIVKIMVRQYIVYYITNEGTIKEQRLNF
jgi:hypothetical protein